MPRILTRQNAVLTDESQYATKQAQIQTEQDAQRNTKLDTANASLTTANTNLVNLFNQQDGVIGAINNTTIGDAQLGHRTYVYAHDTTNGKARALKCDASGRLETSVDALEVTAETINLSTDTLEAKTQAITDKLDSFAGAGNNNVGEGSAKLQTYLYARDVSAGNFKPLVCDGDAHLQVDCLTSALPTGAATEATLSAAKNALFTNPAGTGNTLGENASAINSNIITTNSKIDTTNSKLTTIDTSATAIDIAIGGLRNDLTQNGLGGGNKAGVILEAQNQNLIAISNKMVGGQTTSGMATAQNQQVVDLTLQGIDTILGNIETDAAALEVLQTATNTKLDAIVTDAAAIETLNVTANGILGNIATDAAALEVLQTSTNSKLDTLETTLTAIETDAAALETLQTSTNSKLDTIDGVLDNIKLDTAAIKTAVEILDNVVSGSEAQVDVVSLPALPTGSNTIGTVNLGATDNAVLDAIATDAAALEVLQTSTNSKLDTLETTLTAIETDAAALEVLQTTTNSKLDTLETTLTAIETDAAAIEVLLTSANTDHAANEVLLTTLAGAVKAEDSAHSGGDSGVHILSVRKDTATNLAGSDSDYQPLITGSAGHLHINDSLHHRVKDVAFMTTESISSNSRSSTTLDTEGYSNVVIYGESTGGTSVSGSGDLRIQGSNASSGTYYGIGFLTVSTYESGRFLLIDSDTSNGNSSNGNYPRFLKIFNDTAGTIELTLRATMSNFNTYI